MSVSINPAGTLPVPIILEESRPQHRDMEKQSQEIQQTAIANTIHDSDTTWNGPDDPDNPLNWPARRKWVVTLLTSFGGLVTLMSGNMMAPAVPAIGHDLGIDEATALMALSILVLAFAFGPLILAPMTEVFGRRPVWILSSSWFVIWNATCGFAPNKATMIVSRFMAGLGASGEFAVSIPVLSDCWRPEQRGKSFAISTFVPLLGPAVGPILGGVLTEKAGWRWLFWAVSIFDALLVVVGLCIFKETYAPIILARRARASSEGIDEAMPTRDCPTHFSRLKTSLTRPFRLLAMQPMIQLASVFLAYNFGILYIVHATFAILWIERYHQTVSQSGLNYIAIVLGCTIAAQLGGQLTDLIWHRLQRKAGGATAPEYRVPLMVPGAVLIPLGLFWYGWAAEYRLHWLVPDVGITIFSCGIILNTQALQAYVIDAYGTYTASAMAAAQLLRNFAAFAFPTFAPSLYGKLGYGWGNSLLAFIFLALGLPAPILLWKFGARIRAKGRPLS